VKRKPARKKIAAKTRAPKQGELDESAVLAELLKRKPETAFTASQLAGKAHYRWNRDEVFSAGVLFDAAARRATAEATPGSDQTMVYRSRAAVCFARAGMIERAWPLLEEVVVHDWRACGIEMDSHFSEWAFVEMLSVHAGRGDRSAFAALFARAVARGNELGDPFPFIRPKQELVLKHCEELGLTAEARIVVERIRARGDLPKHLAARVARYPAT
jgi:hypothetical protein